MGIFPKDVTMQVVPIYKTYYGRKPFYQGSIIGKRSAPKNRQLLRLSVFLYSGALPLPQEGVHQHESDNDEGCPDIEAAFRTEEREINIYRLRVLFLTLGIRAQIDAEHEEHSSHEEDSLHAIEAERIDLIADDTEGRSEECKHEEHA